MNPDRPCHDRYAAVAFLIAAEARTTTVRNSAAQQARKVCSTCIIQRECREEAIAIERDGLEVYGVAGGLTRQRLAS